MSPEDHAFLFGMAIGGVLTSFVWTAILIRHVATEREFWCRHFGKDQDSV